jgi:8-oxo-dGTP pyrophosphatase MutT (NUDIX family)
MPLDPRAAELHRAIADHPPSDPLERAHHARVVALLAAAERPLARDAYAPGHLTASAFVLSPDGHALLLIHHRRLERWLQPGGHVEDEDASVRAAAARELHEETGAQARLAQEAPFDYDVHPIPARPGEPGHEHFDVRYLFRADSERLEARAEVKGARWVPLSELDQIATDESVRRAVRKLRAGA